MKNARQQKILDLIEKYDIDTQETLIKYLSECGYNVTQTTISRDIRQLNLVKGISSAGTYKYIAPGTVAVKENNIPILNSAITDSVIKIEAEYTAHTSTNTVYPVEEASSSVASPSNTKATVLNTIGGDKWQTSGQRLTWTFKVNSSGMYQIIPRYIQTITDGMYSSSPL